MSQESSGTARRWFARLGRGDAGRPEFDKAFSKLARAVECYRSRPAQPGEAIALALSVFSYAGACWRLTDGGHVLQVLALLVLTIGSWAVAGFYAEDDPPQGGKDDLLKEITEYEPVDGAAYETLLIKMMEGRWAVRDLAAFMKAEGAANLGGAGRGLSAGHADGGEATAGRKAG